MAEVKFKFTGDGEGNGKGVITPDFSAGVNYGEMFKHKGESEHIDAEPEKTIHKNNIIPADLESENEIKEKIESAWKKHDDLAKKLDHKEAEILKDISTDKDKAEFSEKLSKKIEETVNSHSTHVVDKYENGELSSELLAELETIIRNMELLLEEMPTLAIIKQQEKTDPRLDDEKKKKARESLNAAIVEKLKQPINEKGIKNIKGKDFLNSDLRLMAFFAAAKIFDEGVIAKRLEDSDSEELLPIEQSKIDNIISSVDINELVIKIFVSGEIGKLLSKIKKQNTKTEPLRMEWEYTDDVMAYVEPSMGKYMQIFLKNREDDLSKYKGEKLEKMKKTRGSGVEFDYSKRVAISELIKEYFEKKFNITIKNEEDDSDKKVTGSLKSTDSLKAVDSQALKEKEKEKKTDDVAKEAEKPNKKTTESVKNETEKPKEKEVEKTKEETPAELYSKINEYTRGVITIEKAGQFKNAYIKAIKDAGYDEKTAMPKIMESLAKDLRDSLSAIYKIEDEESEKVIKYILDNLM